MAPDVCAASRRNARRIATLCNWSDNADDAYTDQAGGVHSLLEIALDAHIAQRINDATHRRCQLRMFVFEMLHGVLEALAKQSMLR